MEAESCNRLAMKVGIRNMAVIRQAEELLRLTEVRRQSLTGLNLPSSCKTIICLELAATMMEQTCDKNLTQRQSGVNKKVYASNLKALQRVLDLQPKSTIRDLAIQFGCTEIVDMAQKVLVQYQSNYKGEDMQFGTPLFHGAAVLAAARKSKLKIDRQKITALSGSKKSVFDKLVNELEKLCEEKSDVKGKENAGSKRRHKSFLETLQDGVQENETGAKILKVKEEEKTQVDDYEQWKKRILEKARKVVDCS